MRVCECNGSVRIYIACNRHGVTAAAIMVKVNFEHNFVMKCHRDMRSTSRGMFSRSVNPFQRSNSMASGWYLRLQLLVNVAV